MTIDERISFYVNQLPPLYQAEALGYVEFLLLKAQRKMSEMKSVEEREWLTASLDFGMRGIVDEDEPTYSVEDLKVVF